MAEILKQESEDDDSTTCFLIDPDATELQVTEEGTVLFQPGQRVQLADGTTAYLQAAEEGESENIHQVQLENGTTAFIALSGSALDSLNLEESNLTMVEAEDGNLLQIERFAEVAGTEAENTAEDDEMDFTLDTVEVSDSKIEFKVYVKHAEDSLHVEESPKPKSKTKKSSKLYHCPVVGCSKKYTAVHHLKVHARAHTGDRPFACTESGCDKRFGTNYALKAHIRTHTGEKPYHCPEESCGKGFKTSGDLQKHIRTHTGERPFKCNIPGCNRAFTTSNIRKVHVRTHTGERPYECTHTGCGRTFASATNFKNHLRIHSGEKPYLCTFQSCGKRFTEYSSLYKHQTVHTQQKPYECRDCGRNYRQSSTLTMHRRTAHGIIQAIDGSELILSLPADTGKIENFISSIGPAIRFLELTKDGTALLPLNSTESGDLSAAQTGLISSEDSDSEIVDNDLAENEIAVLSRHVVDEDGNPMGQILVVTEEGDVQSLENFEALQNVDL